jgi:uncharacterized protein
MRGFMKLPRAILAAVLFFAPPIVPWVSADVAIPPLKARVTDLTATLTPEQTAALESKLAAFEQRKGSQLAVLLVPTTQPETVEQYSIRVVDQWKLGRKGVDDGVLLLIAKDDRKLRIEVGRGLEGALPDAIAKRIIAEDIVAPFKKGDFNAGVNAGVDRIIKVVDGEPLPAPKAKSSGASSNIGTNDMFIWGAIAVVLLGGFLRKIFGTFLGSLAAGSIAGVAAAVLGAGVIVGIVVSIIVFVLSLTGISFLGGGGGGGSGGYLSGNWSGGGGGFSGGGASGDW